MCMCMCMCMCVCVCVCVGTRITFEGEGEEQPGKEPGDVIFVIQAKTHESYSATAMT